MNILIIELGQTEVFKLYEYFSSSSPLQEPCIFHNLIVFSLRKVHLLFTIIFK